MLGFNPPGGASCGGAPRNLPTPKQEPECRFKVTGPKGNEMSVSKLSMFVLLVPETPFDPEEAAK